MDDADAMMMDLLFASHKQELLMLLLTTVKQEPVDEEEEKPVLCNAQSSSSSSSSNPANLLPPKVKTQIEKTLSELLSQVKGVMVTSSAVAAMVDSLFGNHRQILLLSLQTAALEAEKKNQNNSVARSSLAANSLPHLFPPHVEAIIENTFTELLAQVKTAMKPAAPPMINNNNNNNNSPNKASQNSDRSRKRTLMIDLTKEVDNDDDQKVKLEPAVKKVKLRLTPKTKKEQEKEAAKIAKQKEAARKKQEREEDRALKKAEATLRKREKEAEKAKKAQEAAKKKREKEAAKIKKEREAARKKREKEAAKAAKAAKAKKKKDKPSVKEVNKKVKAAAVVKDEVKEEEEEEEEQVEVRLPNGTTFPRKFGPVSTECRLVSKHGRCRIANCEGRHDSNGAAVHLARRHLGVHPYRCVFDRRRRCTFSANYRTGVVQHVLEEHLAGAAQLTGDRVADRRLARSFCQVIPLAELQRAK